MKHVTLTPRQLEVAQLLARGYTQSEVAAELRISRRTVEYHAALIRAKANATTTRRAIHARVRAASGHAQPS